MKTKRHSKILELISERDINTQEELLAYLRAAGFDVTQATVSRDIKELRLVKTMVSDGKYRYAPSAADSNADIGTKYANAACAVLDAMNHEGVVGSVAGDDTILVVMRDEKSASTLVGKIKELIG